MPSSKKDKSKESQLSFVTLPNSVEAERSVLGCILNNVSVQLEIIAALDSEDFYQNNHITIFESMQRVSSQTHKEDDGSTVTNTVTLTSLIDDLRRNGKLAEVGDIDYINSICDSVPGSARYKEYVSIVKRASLMRKLISICGEVTKRCYSSDNSEDVITYAEEQIFKLRHGESQRELADLTKAVNETLRKINDRYVNPGMFHGIDTGYTQFDHMTNGLHGGELIVLAARPGGGKSALAMNIVEHVAKQGKTVAIYSLEMSNEQLIERMLSSMSGIPLGHIKSGALEGGESDIVKLQAANNVLCNMKLFGNDYANIKPAEISSQCRRLKAQSGLDMIVIDYIQLMTGDDAKEGRQNEVASITRALKLMAKELNVPVLALAQLKRDAEIRNIGQKGQQQQATEPVLSDLRESGAIEQDADIVLFIHRENPDDKNDSNVNLVIAKHRNGERGNVPLKWIGPLVRFVNPSDYATALGEVGDIPQEDEMTDVVYGEEEDIFATDEEMGGVIDDVPAEDNGETL